MSSESYTVAYWPKCPEINLGNVDNFSATIHPCEASARSAALCLKQKGFGGKGEIFPLNVEVGWIWDPQLKIRPFPFHDIKVFCVLLGHVREIVIDYKQHALTIPGAPSDGFHLPEYDSPTRTCGRWFYEEEDAVAYAERAKEDKIQALLERAENLKNKPIKVTRISSK